MKAILALRVFWTCTEDYGADGYWNHYWRNWVTGTVIQVFAGYTRRGVSQRSSTFKTAIARFKDGWIS